MQLVQSHMNEARLTIISLNLPDHVTEFARQKMENPILADLVNAGGTDLAPQDTDNTCVLCNSDGEKHRVLEEYLLRHGKDQKIMVFTGSNAETTTFKDLKYADFVPLDNQLTREEK